MTAIPALSSPLSATHAATRRVPRRAERTGLDLFRLCLSAGIVLNVSRIHQIYPWLSALRPQLTLTLLSLVAAFMSRKALASPAWTRHWLTKIIIALTVVAVGSIAFGISQGAAFWFFEESYSKVLISCFLLMAATRNARDLRTFIWAYVVGAAVLVWMAIFRFSLVMDNNGLARLANLETWDANDIGVLLLIGLGLCLLLFRTSKALGKLCTSIVLVGIGVAMARSGSRGGFIGLGCVLLAFIVSLKHVHFARRISIVGLIAFSLFFAAPAGYWKQMSTITAPKDDYNWSSAQGRRELAIRGMGYMMSYPIFGIGAGNFGRAELTISPLAGQTGIRESAAHNTYVQAGAEMGVPGFMLFIVLTLGGIVVPWRLRRKIPPSWRSGSPDEQFLFQAAMYLPLAAIGFAVPAYFVSFAYADPVYILAAMAVSLTCCVAAKTRLPRGDARPAARRKDGFRGRRQVAR